MPAYWACLDLTTLPRPTALFDEIEMTPAAAAPPLLLPPSGAVVSAPLHHTRPSARGHFEALSRLTLRFCDALTDTHLERLPPSVQHLVLDACHAVTDKGIKAVAQKCAKRLELLSVYWNTNVGNASCLALSLRCPSLTSLSLSGCKRVSTAGVLGLASRCRKLEVLDLTRCRDVEGLALETLAQMSPRLTELRLYAASQLADPPLLAVAKHCAGLTTLDCTGLPGLTDAPLVALGNGCPRLRVLMLTWATGVTDLGVCAVARGCPLATLSLHGLRAVGPASLHALAAHCARTLVAIDVRGCAMLPEAERQPEALARTLPRLRTFVLAT